MSFILNNETGEITWLNIVAVLVISQKIVIKHPKQVVKVVNIAAVISKMIRSVHLKPGKKAVKIAMAAAANQVSD
ncbi:hypothetical protein SAMN04487787_11449 [Kosakonia sacchari]|nr:hypothetical protein SAMN04487787_11449 [Kosakonia sacchari]